jgi:hypothetical protein
MKIPGCFETVGGTRLAGFCLVNFVYFVKILTKKQQTTLHQFDRPFGGSAHQQQEFCRRQWVRTSSGSTLSCNTRFGENTCHGENTPIIFARKKAQPF